MNKKNEFRTLNLWAHASSDRAPDKRSRQRLARAFSGLEVIQLARSLRHDPLLGKLAEERIIWRELLDLELQYIDEEIERISTGAGEVIGER
jgi:hypothetical protein